MPRKSTPGAKGGKKNQQATQSPQITNVAQYPENDSNKIPEIETGGTDGTEAAAWANHIKEFAWPSEPNPQANSRHLSTCQVLRQLTSKREPHVRRLCGQDMHVKISSRIENLESALAQVCGDAMEKPCERCEMGFGPWVSCVVAEELRGACANCHWMANGEQCSFSNAPADDNAENQWNASGGSFKKPMDLNRRVREGRVGKCLKLKYGRRLDRLRLSLSSVEAVLYEIAAELEDNIDTVPVEGEKAVDDTTKEEVDGSTQDKENEIEI